MLCGACGRRCGTYRAMVNYMLHAVGVVMDCMDNLQKAMDKLWIKHGQLLEELPTLYPQLTHSFLTCKLPTHSTTLPAAMALRRIPGWSVGWLGCVLVPFLLLDD